MNKQFEAKALFLKTNRMRRQILEAKDANEVTEILKETGYSEPFEINELPPIPPTEAQLNYARDLKINIPTDANKKDLSALIQKKLDYDSDPNPDLVEYAIEKEIQFSKYIGKKALYDLVFDNLNQTDKIAFFIFSIYRWLSNDRNGNLEKHQYKSIFYEFAHEQTNNEQFVKSMSKYPGSKLRFFGLIKFKNGNESYGGSQNTIAYKTCAEFLNKKLGVNKTKTISIQSEDLVDKKAEFGCLNKVTTLLILTIILIKLMGILN